MLNYYDAIMLVLGELGGYIKGRTVLQKIIYFLSRAKIVEDSFIPHYYGPYSKRVFNSLIDLVSFGFLEEKEQIDYEERRQYIYLLTEDGTKIFEEIKSKNQQEYLKTKKILEIIRSELGLNYLNLATAAKYDYILNRDITSDLDRIRALIYWKISEEDLNRVKHFLQAFNRFLDNLGDLR